MPYEKRRILTGPHAGLESVPVNYVLCRGCSGSWHFLMENLDRPIHEYVFNLDGEIWTEPSANAELCKEPEHH